MTSNRKWAAPCTCETPTALPSIAASEFSQASGFLAADIRLRRFKSSRHHSWPLGSTIQNMGLRSLRFCALASGVRDRSLRTALVWFHVQGTTMFMVMIVLNSKVICDCCLLKYGFGYTGLRHLGWAIHRCCGTEIQFWTCAVLPCRCRFDFVAKNSDSNAVELKFAPHGLSSKIVRIPSESTFAVAYPVSHTDPLIFTIGTLYGPV